MLKFERILAQKAKEMGVCDVQIGRTKNHPRLSGNVGGKPISLVFAGVPGTPQAEKNCIKQLRKIIAAAGGSA